MIGAIPLLDRLIGAAAGCRWPHPFTAALERLRAARERYLPCVRPLWEPLARGEAGAEVAFDGILLEAMAWLRGAAAAAAGPVLGRVEVALYREGAERIDDPGFPRPARERVVALIDRASRVQGTYAALAREVAPLLARAGPRPRLLDVAGGAGGFACFLAERSGAALELESSDRCADYVAQGEARARRRGLAVRFRTFDALDPRPGAARADVLTCLHALHHFAPGPAARLLGVCARLGSAIGNSSVSTSEGSHDQPSRLLKCLLTIKDNHYLSRFFPRGDDRSIRTSTMGTLRDTEIVLEN